MKILLTGDGHSIIHERACGRALEHLGHDVHLLRWCTYFKPLEPAPQSRGAGWSLRVQNKLIAGPTIRRMNRDLITAFESYGPDVVFIYRGTHIYPETLQALKERGALLVGFNNDDPFSSGASSVMWRHLRGGISLYDVSFVYREHNVADYIAAGAECVHLLRSYYIPELHRPVELTAADSERYECDVVFAGHYEDDGRMEMLEAIAARGFKLNLFGPEWERPASKSRYLAGLCPVEAVRGDEYCKAISGAKIALCFLSKLNRDTYTRRCFEIPAMGTFMLSEYSDDLAGMFDEGAEAEYFRDSAQLLCKIAYYLEDERQRRSIANAGAERVRRDGHDVISRMEHMMKIIAGHTGVLVHHDSGNCTGTNVSDAMFRPAVVKA